MTSAACSPKDIKAAFLPPHLWVVQFSKTDNRSSGLNRQVHAGYLTRKEQGKLFRLLQQLLPLPTSSRAKPCAPAPAETTPTVRWGASMNRRLHGKPPQLPPDPRAATRPQAQRAGGGQEENRREGNNAAPGNTSLTQKSNRTETLASA